MKTAIVTSDTSENHLTGDGHPEQPKKSKINNRKLKKKERFDLGKTRIFDQKILKKAHTENYLNNFKNSFPKKGIKFS